MGRAPCCDKANVKKGPWSPEEDAKLKSYIEQHGTGGNWIALPQKIGLKRCGKSCRLRWLNYLRPNIKHGGFSEEEDNIICSLYISIGSRWSIIAAQLPGRTDNDIKNYWNTRLKKKLLGKQRKEHARRENNLKQQQGVMKKESENVGISGVINQTSYWRELPVSVPIVNQNQDLHVKDQESIRNLLIKLGGRFLDDHQQQNPTITTNFQNHIAISSTQDQVLYDNSINMLASSTVQDTHYEVNGASPNMFQELENFPVELSSMIYGNHQQVDMGLESFYGLDMVNGSTGTSSSESSSWGDISSLVYPPMASSYEVCPQDFSAFEERRYLGLQ